MSEPHDNPFHNALNQLLAASYHASAAELTPIFDAISVLAEKYSKQISAKRREAQALFVERQLAERGRKR
jgi:hypothetical protein